MWIVCITSSFEWVRIWMNIKSFALRDTLIIIFITAVRADFSLTSPSGLTAGRDVLLRWWRLFIRGWLLLPQANDLGDLLPCHFSNCSFLLGLGVLLPFSWGKNMQIVWMLLELTSYALAHITRFVNDKAKKIQYTMNIVFKPCMVC